MKIKKRREAAERTTGDRKNIGDKKEKREVSKKHSGEKSEDLKKERNEKNRASKRRSGEKSRGIRRKSKAKGEGKPDSSIAVSRKEIFTGVLLKHKKGFGFIEVTDERKVDGDIGKEGEKSQKDVYVSEKNIKGAMSGDKVEAVLISPRFWKGERPEGRIVRVTERKSSHAVGTFFRGKGFGFVVPEGPRTEGDVFISKKYFSGAQNGDKVVCDIITYSDGESRAEGRITEIIAKNGEAGADIKALIRARGYFKTFPSRCQAQAKALSKKGVVWEEGKRRDIRGKSIITIDGADSKDFDDAVSIEILPNGNYLLGVHIADVSHYIDEESPLDNEALKRGTSIYLIDQVVPMLPPELSDDLCSLRPHQDRLTLSVDIEITKNGQIVGHDIYESVINSRERMVYDDVSDIIEGKSPELRSRYNHIYDDIMKMVDLAEILSKKRKERGSLDFDLEEAHIKLDNQGIPLSVEIAERRMANRLIEEFMLTANEVVARHFCELNIPFVYRVHEKPSLEKMEELTIFLKGFGINLNENPENVHPKALAKVLSDVEGESYEMVVSSVMLRSMKKAVYLSECEGHFGLALKYYCHFTSPIRRYPDLMIHRIIKESLIKLPEGKRLAVLRNKAEAAADLSSANERKAIELEREVEKLKKAEYMSYHIGEEFEGIISGVGNYGIYAALANTIEGMVRLEWLEDDYYDCEPEKYRIIGRNTGKIYSLGQSVKVKVYGVSIENREIDFLLL